jgi:hypothetical protein
VEAYACVSCGIRVSTYRNKAISVPGHGGFSHFLERALTDCGDAVRLSAVRANRPVSLYTAGDSWVLLPDRDRHDTRATERLERLGKLEKAMISSGIEPGTFRLAAQRIN